MGTGSSHHIRPAVVDDSAGLARVQVDSYRTAYAGLFSSAYLAAFTYEEQEGDWRDLIAGGVEGVLYVAESEAGETVGYALGWVGDGGVPPYDAELVALHVRRDHQGQGLGRGLVRTVAGSPTPM